jgi:hypothetical protein
VARGDVVPSWDTGLRREKSLTGGARSSARKEAYQFGRGEELGCGLLSSLGRIGALGPSSLFLFFLFLFPFSL